MNASDYKAAGYALSQLIEQAIITRAENDVISAYIVPLLGHIPTNDERGAEPVKTAIMALSFLLVQQRSRNILFIMLYIEKKRINIKDFLN